jgi:hypothetical protein
MLTRGIIKKKRKKEKEVNEMMKNPSGIIIHKMRKVNDEMSKHKMFIQLSDIREFCCKILRVRFCE